MADVKFTIMYKGQKLEGTASQEPFGQFMRRLEDYFKPTNDDDLAVIEYRADTEKECRQVRWQLGVFTPILFYTDQPERRQHELRTARTDKDGRTGSGPAR